MEIIVFSDKCLYDADHLKGNMCPICMARALDIENESIKHESAEEESLWKFCKKKYLPTRKN
jgi:hypothetical protein